MGAFVGTVKEIRHDSFNVAGVASFSNGDGLCFFDDNRELVGFRANKVVGNRIFPYRMPNGLKSGVLLYRNNVQMFDRLMSKTSAERKIPIRLSLRAVEKGFELSTTSGILVSVNCEHQMAQRPQRENIIRQLTKLGDTIFTCSEVDISDDFNFFIPNSVLSEMRRELVAKMMGARNRRESSVDRIMQSSSKIPTYAYSYLYNISNRLSKRFYDKKELSAFELKGGTGPIMQCRHCIRYTLGACVKHGGERPSWQEPLSLVLGDGRRFRLEFDCQHCQMNVYAS
jgi:putative protease